MVGVELPRRNRGIKGTSPSTLAARPTYRMGAGDGSYSFCTPVGRAAPGQDHGLEGAVEHELGLDVVRAVRVIGPSRQPCAHGPQMAREKQLRPDHPALVEGNIRGFPHHWGTVSTTSCETSLSHGYPCHNFMMIRISVSGIYVINCVYIPEGSCCESDALAS